MKVTHTHSHTLTYAHHVICLMQDQTAYIYKTVYAIHGIYHNYIRRQVKKKKKKKIIIKKKS